MATYPVSDHCDGERFFNPHRSARPLREVIKWARTRQRTPWPTRVPLTPHPPPPAAVRRGEVAVTFIGHSTFLIRTATTVILTDPVFTPHAGPFGRLGPPRVRPPALAPSSLPSVDLVLVSHNHYDHLQPSSLRLFSERASYVTPLGVAAQLRIPPKGGNYRVEKGEASAAVEKGQASAAEIPVASASARKVSSSHPVVSAPARKIASSDPVVSAFRRKIVELDWWQSATAGGVEITSVPAQHFSARMPWDRDRTLWCGFIVRVDDVTIYFAGDSGYSPQFKEIGQRFPAIDVALLPIGAYEPRWFMSPVHMNPEEAVRAHLDVRPRVSVGMHFGTFQLTDEGIDEPLRALERAREAHGMSAEAFGVLDFGESKIFRQ